MKRMICRISAVCLLAATLLLTSCGSFFSEETLQIESVTPVTLGDGSIQITITYVDDVEEPSVFVIPKGNTGEDGPVGNGIETIQVQHDNEKKQTVLTVVYKDKENYPDQSFYIPDGVGIVDVEDVYDEVTGSHTITFISSNPSIYQFSPLTIPRGEKGEKGNGIKDYRVEEYEKVLENGDVEKGIRYTFILDDGTEDSVDIPNPLGIAGIEGEEDGDTYLLKVTYTNGTVIPIPFQRPADPNKWYSGGNVNDLTSFFGDDGDFFFDTAHRDIWLKENGSWKKVVSFGSNYTVTFDLNDNDLDPETKASLPKGASSIYSIEAGTYFTASGYDIPIPTRAGYEFCGWYTKKTVNPLTMSPFTDLTPVSADLTLYAIWEKVE